MIEINLLPQDRKPKEPAYKKIGLANLDFLKNIPVRLIAVILIASLVSIHILLFGVGMYSRLAIDRLDKAFTGMTSGRKEADSIKAQIALKKNKVDAINSLIAKRFSWSKKLNALSDSMTTGVWLNELSYEERMREGTPQAAAQKGVKTEPKQPAMRTILKYLVLTGHASSVGGQGTALIGKFISSLKDNSSFYSDFQQIELVTMKSGKYDGQEVMDFKIACLFKN
jgi:hypothetical protein